MSLLYYTLPLDYDDEYKFECLRNVSFVPLWYLLVLSSSLEDYSKR